MALTMTMTMTMTTWLAFLTLSLATTFSPGPAVLLAMSTTLAVGPRRTFFSSAGNGLGIFVVSCVALTSVGVLLRTSESAFTALKICGAAYLIYLGWKQWRPAPSKPAGLTPVNMEHADSRLALFRRGLVVALSNPKGILFFTAVFPQFIPMDHPRLGDFLLLSLTFVASSFLAHLSWVLLAQAFSSGRVSGKAMVYVNRVSGLIFIGLGCAMLTLSARPA